MTTTNPLDPLNEIEADNFATTTTTDTDKQLAARLKATLAKATSTNPVNFADVAKLAAEISKVETRIEKADRAAAKAANSDDTGPTDTDLAAAYGEKKTQLRAELKRRDFHYVTANEKFWLKSASHDWIPVSEKGLTRDILMASNLEDRNLLYAVMKEDGRWYDRCTYTFDKCDDKTLNMLVRDFCDVAEGEAHWFFDTLIRSIAGEKAENYDHIEKAIVTKFLHPESVTIPALLIQDGGGTGKGLTAHRLLPAIFGEHGVGSNMRVNHVVGKFNSVGQGMAVWCLNEASRGGYSHSALKALVGSETYAIEHKGVNPIMSPMTAWVWMFTQDVDGAVLLEGGGADRRWSVVQGNRELGTIVAERLDCTQDEAKLWIDTVGKFILSDRKEAGRWVNSLIARHGDQRIAHGLHGEDYRAMRNIQRPIERLVFEAVFDDEDFEMIRTSVLYDFYCANLGTGRTPFARGKFYELAEKYIREFKPTWTGRVSFNLENADKKRSKVDAFVVEKPSGTRHTDGSHHYRVIDDYGRTTWRIGL